MKKVVFLIAILSFALVSCSSDDESMNETTNQQKSKSQTETEQAKLEEGSLASMSDEDFVEALFDLFLEYGYEGALSISFDGNGNLIHDYDPDFEGEPGAIVCEGKGASFAYCVKDWLEDHPGECLKITYHENSDTFTADDDC